MSILQIFWLFWRTLLCGEKSLGDPRPYQTGLRFQVTPSNIFVVYPSIVTEITGLGFSFQPLSWQSIDSVNLTEISAQMWQGGHVAGLHRASTNLLCKRYFRTPMHRNWLINVNYSSTPEDSVSKILLEVHGEFISTLVQCRARMTSSFTGRFWCMVNEGNSPQTVEARLGTVGVCIKIGHPMKISRFTKFTHIEYEFSPK